METFTVNKQQADKEGRNLIFYISISDFEYILINLCNKTRWTVLIYVDPVYQANIDSLPDTV